MQAIHDAAASGHVEVMVLLIEHFGVDPQEKAEVGFTKQLNIMCVGP